MLTEAVSFPLAIIFLYLTAPLSDPLLLLVLPAEHPPTPKNWKKESSLKTIWEPMDLFKVHSTQDSCAYPLREFYMCVITYTYEYACRTGCPYPGLYPQYWDGTQTGPK